jgi:hypothetical protein
MSMARNDGDLSELIVATRTGVSELSSGVSGSERRNQQARLATEQPG